MLRSRSFHRSTPNLTSPSTRSVTSHSATRPPPLPSNQIVGRDELEERYLDLRDQHLALRREATAAQEEVRQLHVRLSRLIEEKKRYFKHRRTDREVVLEEQIYNLEQELIKQSRLNERLRDRVQLMKVQGPQQGQGAGQVITTTQKRISSAYAHIQSRTDSGLGPPPPGTVYSFRPLSVSKSSLDLSHHRRSSPSGILKNGHQHQLPPTAAMLMAEAKEEIIRLEEIVAEQQIMLDTLLGADEDFVPGPSGPNASATSASISYQLTTTTTATASLTPGGVAATSGHQLTNGTQSSLGPETNGLGESQLDLYNKYQKLMMRQESAQKLSTDVRALVESLYRSLREEKGRVIELRGKLTDKKELNLVIAEKDQQIEALRKENALLQQSLADCITQCMSITSDISPNTAEVTINPTESQSTSASRYLDTLKATFTRRAEAYQVEIDQLTEKLSQMEQRLATEQSRAEQLQRALENLQQLSENDQLHIKHLQAKITRLSGILFPGGTGTPVTPPSSLETRRPKTARASVAPEKAPVLAKSSSGSSSISEAEVDGVDLEEEEQVNSPVTEQLDQLLSSLPPTPQT